MQTAQPGLSSKVTDATVILPSNTSEVQIVRDTAADGAGKYYGYLNSGVKEPIGGSNSQFAVDITYNPLTRVLTATQQGGGSAPATYLWQIKSATTAVVGVVNISYSGATNASTATLNAPGVGETIRGMASVKVTDAQGNVAYATFFVEEFTPAP